MQAIRGVYNNGAFMLDDQAPVNESRIIVIFEESDLRYNAETEAAIQEANDIMAGKVYAKSYSSVAEMNADIDAEEDI